MAAGAEQLEVVELVAPAVAEWDAVVHLKAAVRAAADAGSAAFVDAGADLAPASSRPDLPSLLPVVVAAGAGGAGVANRLGQESAT